MSGFDPNPHPGLEEVLRGWRRPASSCTSSTSRPGRRGTAPLHRPLAGPVAAWMPVGRALDSPGRRDRPGPRRAVGGGGHRDRVGQVALLPAARRRGGGGGRAGHGPDDVPHQGPGPGPAACPRRTRGPGAGRRHLRRRHRRPRTAPGCDANANVVLTNPDMLHVGILPAPRPLGHLPHAPALRRASTSCTRCAGIFGTHVAHLLRRLRRLCAHYGVEPHVRVLLGHHRRAGAAGVGAVRARRRRGHRRRLATRRAPLRALEPAAARRGRGRPRVGARRDGRCCWPRSSAAGHRDASPSAAAARAPSWWPARAPPRCPTSWRRQVSGPYRGGYLAERAA